MAPRNNISGLLVIDKPTGMASRRALDQLEKLLPGIKMGHAGTLDPAACGVLVICLGKATRLIPFVQQMPKHYRATVRLGWRSDTHDLEGTVQPVPFPGRIDRRALERCLAKFRGEIMQVPPQHSAVRVRGRRAYELARQGQQVTLRPAPVRIDRLECTRLDYPEAELEVVCGSGTYIRSLARDIGKELGCGAVLANLTRLGVGPFHLQEAISPRQLDSEALTNKLLPASAAVGQLASIILSPAQRRAAIHGRAVPCPGGTQLNSSARHVALMDSSGEIIAVAELGPGSRLLHPRIVLADASDS